jgi:PAS domain S-box-containing protein
VRAGEERGLLAIGVEALDLEPSLADLVAFFSDDETSAAVFDAAGNVLAHGRADMTTASGTGEAYAEIAENGRSLRLYLSSHPPSERVLPPAQEAESAFPPPGPEELQVSVTPKPAELTPSVAPQASSKPPSKHKSAESRELPSDAARGARRLVVAPKNAPAAPAFTRPAASSVAAAAKGAQHSSALPKPPQPEAAEPAELPPSRTITAGRVPRELSRKPVRFLWQTDGSDRFLFVSPGLAQVVGRNAEIVGERWQDAAGRLRLDPTSRIARAVSQRDTWSGQTAWWPVEGSNVRVPAELTALPIFGPDHSFQGYRGFGVLRPAEALMPAAFEARFGAVDQAAALIEQLPPYEEAVATGPAIATPANVVPIRADLERSAEQARLTAQERTAFEEIAAALRDRVVQAPVSLDPTESEPDPTSPDPEPAQEGAQQTGNDRGHAGSETPEDGERQADEQVAEDPAAVAPHQAISDKGPTTEKDPEPERHAELPAEIIESGSSRREHGRADNPAFPAETGITAPPLISAPDNIANPKPIPDKPALVLSPVALEGAWQRRVRELTAILDTATDGVLILDAEGTIESVNAGAEALFGLEAHELQGTDFGELLTPESRQSALDYLSGLIDNGVASLLNEGREVEAQAGPGSIPLFHDDGQDLWRQRRPLLHRSAGHHALEAHGSGIGCRPTRSGRGIGPEIRVHRARQPRDPHAA